MVEPALRPEGLSPANRAIYEHHFGPLPPFSRPGYRLHLSLAALNLLMNLAAAAEPAARSEAP